MMEWLINKLFGPDPTMTPGILYAMMYIFCAWVYSMAYPKRKPRRDAVPVQILLCLVEILLYTIAANAKDLLFISVMTAGFLVILAFIYITCEMTWLTTVYAGVICFLMAEMTVSLVWEIFYFLRYRQSGSIPFPVIILICLPVWFGLPFFFWWLLNRLNHGTAWQVEARDTMAIFGIGFFAYTLSNISYVDIPTPFSVLQRADVLVLRTITDMAGIAVLLVYHLLTQEARRRLEIEQMNQILQAQYTNYQISKESVDLINHKYHDLKHQIIYLKSEVADGEKMKMLDQMEDEIRQYEASNKTGNSVLDTILTSKNLVCQQHGIHMTCVADGQALNFLTTMDICSIFGNALDNAIESVIKLTEEERRLIHVSVSKDRGFLRIRVENCFDGNLNRSGDTFLSTKNDSRYHGFGIKSIQAIATKYKGSLLAQPENEWFVLSILIPIPRDAMDA